MAGLAPELRWSLKLVACSVAASAGDPGWATVIYDALEPYSGRNCVLAYTTFVGAIDHHLGLADHEHVGALDFSDPRASPLRHRTHDVRTGGLVGRVGA